MDYHWSFFWSHWEPAQYRHFVETDRVRHKRKLIRRFSWTSLADRLDVILPCVKTLRLRVIIWGPRVKKCLISWGNEFDVVVILLSRRTFGIILKWIFWTVVVFINVPRLWLGFGRGLYWVERAFTLMGFWSLDWRIYVKLIIDLRLGLIFFFLSIVVCLRVNRVVLCMWSLEIRLRLVFLLDLNVQRVVISTFWLFGDFLDVFNRFFKVGRSLFKRVVFSLGSFGWSLL